jgi:hypothetical protein
MAILKLGDANDDVTISLAVAKITYLTEQGGMLVASEHRSKTTQAALLRAAQGSWVLLDYTGYQTWVNGLRVADCKRVCEGDQIRIAGTVATFFEIIRIVVEAGSELLNPEVTCSFDLTGFKVGDEVVYCPACNAPHHAECWTYNEESCAVCAYQVLRGPQVSTDEGDRRGSFRPQTALEDATGVHHETHEPQSVRDEDERDRPLLSPRPTPEDGMLSIEVVVVEKLSEEEKASLLMDLASSIVQGPSSIMGELL